VLSCAFAWGKAHVQGVKVNPTKGVKLTSARVRRDRWLAVALGRLGNQKGGRKTRVWTCRIPQNGRDFLIPQTRELDPNAVDLPAPRLDRPQDENDLLPRLLRGPSVKPCDSERSLILRMPLERQRQGLAGGKGGRVVVPTRRGGSS